MPQLHPRTEDVYKLKLQQLEKERRSLQLRLFLNKRREYWVRERMNHSVGRDYVARVVKNENGSTFLAIMDYTDFKEVTLGLFNPNSDDPDEILLLITSSICWDNSIKIKCIEGDFDLGGIAISILCSFARRNGIYKISSAIKPASPMEIRKLAMLYTKCGFKIRINPRHLIITAVKIIRAGL